MRLSVLNLDTVQRIDSAARSILQRVGVAIPHEATLGLFAQAGAEVDPANGRVRIPSGLIDECLQSAGKKFTLYGRDRTHTAVFGAGRRNYNTSGGQPFWVERPGVRRMSCLDDVVTAAKLGDVLSRINIVGAMADPHELDVSWRCVRVAATLLQTTTKPVMFFLHDRASTAHIVELLQIVTDGQAAEYPPMFPFLEPISPLRFPTNGIDTLLETCKIPLPVLIGPMAQVGMSAPATLSRHRGSRNGRDPGWSLYHPVDSSRHSRVLRWNPACV